MKRLFSAVSSMKNLAKVPMFEQLSFVNSFDTILADMGGVVWMMYNLLPGASTCINTLKRNGKNVHYVTNNSTVPIETIHEKLNTCGIDAKKEDIISPITAILAHLKKIQFNKDVYLIGLKSVKMTLQQEGYTVQEGPQVIDESIPGLVAELTDDENIGAVLVQFDLNLSYVKLQKALPYLRRKDCLFLAGAGDSKLPFGKFPIIGPHYFLKPLKDLSGREPYQIAKPSIHYNDFIIERFKIADPARVLFIGDSVYEDLNFATKCGYHKLLVLSGVTRKEELTNWEYPEEYKPQYYIESLKALNDVINNFM